jgi:hypothetical protein
MQIKIVENILHNKIKHWADHVEKSNKEIADLIRKHAVVMGRAITNLMTNDDVNDYDVYFNDMDAAHKVISFYCRMMPTEYTWDLIKTETPTGYKVKIVSVGNYVENGSEFEDETTSSLNEVEKELLRSTNEVNRVKLKADKSNKEDFYRPVCITQNAITLFSKIQIVTRFVGTPDYIVNFYDYAY